MFRAGWSTASVIGQRFRAVSFSGKPMDSRLRGNDGNNRGNVGNHAGCVIPWKPVPAKAGEGAGVHGP